VHTIDRVAETVISTGGFLVLVAVLGICVYLAAVVVPLFSPGTVGERHQVSGVVPVGDVVLDPYQRAFAVIDAAGGVRVMAAADGQELAAPRGEAPHSPVTSLSVARNGDLVATGHADGSVRVGSIRFGASTVETDPGRGVGEVWIQDGAVLEVTDAGRARRSELVVDLGKPIDLKTGSGPVVRLDYTIDPTGKTALLAVREDGSVLVNSVRTVRPLGGGAPTVRLTTVAFQIAATEIPRWAFVTADAAQVFLVDEDGGLRRYSRAGSEFSLAETVRGVPEGRRVTAASMLLGAQSLLIGDDEGTVRSWHVAGIADADRPDAVRLYMAHEFAGSTGPILDMSPSTRDRSLVILGENGSVRVRHTTSEKIIADFESGLDAPGAARLWPKNDGVLVLGRRGRVRVAGAGAGLPRVLREGPVRQSSLRGAGRAVVCVPVVLGRRRVGGQTQRGAVDLRHPQGDGGGDAVRGADGHPGGGVHERVSQPQGASLGQARRGDDGIAALGGPGVRGRDHRGSVCPSVAAIGARRSRNDSRGGAAGGAPLASGADAGPQADAVRASTSCWCSPRCCWAWGSPC
jgi:WD40 repeat protein